MTTDRVTIGYFSGSQYWEVMLDGKQVYTTSDKRDAYMFAAELEGKLC